MKTENRGGVRTSLNKKLRIMKAKAKKQLPPELIILLIIGIPFFIFQLIRFLIQNLPS